MSMHDLLNRKELRDTTPNSPGEVLRRFLSIAMVAGLVLGGLLIFLAWAGRDEARLRGAYGCLAVGLGLLATRHWWRVEPAAGVAQAGKAVVMRPDDVVRGASGRPRVLLLNASLAGEGGNSARLLADVRRRLAGAEVEVVEAVLTGERAETFGSLEPVLRGCDALVIATGTHWDSWSAPLQKFLEEATPTEASALWMGKPVAVLVTEHSTGGKGVLSRLQGVLVTFGCLIPPLSGLVLSQAAQLARSHVPDTAAVDDFWSPADLEVVVHNLLAAARAPGIGWRAWAVDRKNFGRPWLDVS
jgi:chromate reductase